MLRSHTLRRLLLALVLLTACDRFAAPPLQTTATPAPAASARPAATEIVSAAATASIVWASPTPWPTATPITPVALGTPIPAVTRLPQTINEPARVVTTNPTDKAIAQPVDRDEMHIAVQFNHPVVPLVPVADQSKLPQPLTFEPPLSGTGQWINTTTYAYSPSQDLVAATRYVVTVQRLQDLLGQTFDGYAWAFETEPPAIAQRSLGGQEKLVGISAPISVTFNVKMDHASVEALWSVRNAETQAPVSGQFQWNESGFRFDPDRPLSHNTAFVAGLKAGAQAAQSEAKTTQDNYWTFYTVKAPGLSTSIRDGEQNVNVYARPFGILFDAPMDPDHLHLSITPTITEQVDWPGWRNDQDMEARVYGNWQASQAYTVTIYADSLSRDGEKLSQDTVIHFTTAPLPPYMHLNRPGSFSVYDLYGPLTIFTTYHNVERINYRLFRVPLNALTLRDFDERYYGYYNGRAFQPKEEQLIDEWTRTVQARPDSAQLISTTLTIRQPGLYYIQANAPGVNWTEDSLLVVSGLNLALKYTGTEALVWVTDLKTGQPVAHQPLELFSGTLDHPLVVGQSDRDGVWRATFSPRKRNDPLVVVSRVDGQIVGVASRDWSNDLRPWNFSLPFNPEPDEFYANLYTDRAIYRPGQAVEFKGILRRDSETQYSLPYDIQSVNLRAVDPQEREIWSRQVPLSHFGTFDDGIKLADAAATGTYRLELRVGGGSRYLASAYFDVAEYRKPEFQAAVHTDQAEYYAGDKIKANADASYFFGGPVADADVKWSVSADDLYFYPANVDGYWDFDDYDYASERNPHAGIISQGTGTTDAKGEFEFVVPAELADMPSSQSFTVQAEIEDITHQTVSSRVVVPVHKGRFYIGLQPQSYCGAAGKEQAVNVLTVNTAGAAVANQPLTLSVFQRQWYSIRTRDSDGYFYWRSAFTDTLESKIAVTTDGKGRAIAKFVPRSGGSYRIVADGTDAAGNSIRSATSMWLSSSEFINWRMENNDRINLVADRKSYSPGDVAEILIPAPFKDAEALLTIERGAIRDVRRIHLKSNSERVSIPILSDYAPNVYVSVMLVKGHAADSPVAQFKLGYIDLPVSIAEKELHVTLTPDKNTNYGPGENATFTIQATRYDGTPAVAEFSVALVDKAIQSLRGENAGPVLNTFYDEHPLSVQTAATLVRSIDRLNQELQAKAKGGGGGMTVDAPDSVRRSFRDTAYWNPSVVTDGQGRAQFTVPLPDNLTTWNLTAKGVTMSTEAGEARLDILSTKDLLVRPVTPRFFVLQDRVQLEAVVNNNTEQDVTTTVRLEAQGLAVRTAAQQPVLVRAHNKARVSWDTSVQSLDSVVVKFTATGGQRQDSVEQTIPVRRPMATEAVASPGQVESQMTERIQISSTVEPETGRLQVDLNPSLAAAARDGLGFLESFDYDCSEQTVSKFLPNIVTYQALRKLQVERPGLAQDLERNISRELQRLYGLQRNDGGWGWWSNDKSLPTLTAYALFALHAADQAGFAVDRPTMTRAENSLRSYLAQPVDTEAKYAYNERAFVLFVLTEVGEKDTGRAVALFEERAHLGNYGKAFLLMTLDRLSQPQAQVLKTELTSSAIQSASGAHWEEVDNDYWTLNTNTRTTAIVLLALARTDPRNMTIANTVRWLMATRKQGHWETTQETAWSVLALSEYMAATGELRGNYDYQVSLNGRLIGSGNVTPDTVEETRQVSVTIQALLQSTANDLTMTRSAGDGRLYYSAYLTYSPPVESMSALDQGILVYRQYEAVDPLTLQPTGRTIQSAKVGDYVRVTLTIVTPNDLNYFALEDPLPAGFEPVDTSLDITNIGAAAPALTKKGSAARSRDAWYWRFFWSYWAHTEMRDDRVAAFATYLGRGTYEYSYLIHASVAGEFRVMPAHAWEVYFPEVFGRTAGSTFVIRGD